MTTTRSHPTLFKGGGVRGLCREYAIYWGPFWFICAPDISKRCKWTGMKFSG